MATPDETQSTSSTAVWTCRLAGHLYELEVTPGLSTRLVLRVDGEQVHDKRSMDERRTIRAGGGRRVEVRMSALGGVKRATAHDGDVDLDFDAPAGSRAARTQEWGRRHPTWYALRHVVIAVGGILVVMLGLGALMKALIEPVIRWIAERMPELPRIPWPDINLPRIPWPHFDLPDIPWPHFDIPWPNITPPWWWTVFTEWLGQHEDIIKPLLFAVMLALFEVRRQRRQRRLRESAEAGSDSPEVAGSKRADAAPDGDVPDDTGPRSAGGPADTESDVAGRAAEVPGDAGRADGESTNASSPQTGTAKDGLRARTTPYEATSAGTEPGDSPRTGATATRATATGTAMVNDGTVNKGATSTDRS